MGAPTKQQLQLLVAAGVDRPVLDARQQGGRLVAVLLGGDTIAIELGPPRNEGLAASQAASVRPDKTRQKKR